VIGTLTVLPVFALAGAVSVVVTSAIGVMVVLPLAVSGAALAPSDVVVAIVLLTATGPVAGAVYDKVMFCVCPFARLPARPVIIIAPVPLLYVQVAPVQLTPLRLPGRVAE
jgi:hypothetical protein